MQIFLYYIYEIIQWALYLFSLVIVINAILSWVPFLNNSKLGRFINRIVNPYLNLFRVGIFSRLANATGIDFSPVIGLALIYFVENYVLNWIFRLVL